MKLVNKVILLEAVLDKGVSDQELTATLHDIFEGELFRELKELERQGHRVPAMPGASRFRDFKVIDRDEHLDDLIDSRRTQQRNYRIKWLSVSAAVAILISYLCVSFTYLQFDFTQWTVNVRSGALVLSLPFFVALALVTKSFKIDIT